ncbi:uncharacterized protein LOC128229855 [Mya arenaria]|uniref:uncharacterized protein LOC128229855 n=1 Tax=Mya arenaria TaxID=6604 RepID=UPI0022DFAF9D|nr:uncharacterized protein LOC128229855 [Mya arenaria]
MQANQNRMYAENDSLMLRVKMTEQTAARARASLPKESRVAAKKQVLQETVTPANNARFDKTAETETLAEIAENMTVAVVEYTNQSVYIGEMEGNMMTFARRPVGKLTSSLNVKNKQSTMAGWNVVSLLSAGGRKIKQDMALRLTQDVIGTN